MNHPNDAPRPHFLDESPINFARPEIQSLWRLLEQNLYRVDDTVAVLDKAEVSKGRILLEQPPRARWHDALAAAAAQQRARRIVEVIAADGEWGALRSRLGELLGPAPPREVGPHPIEWKAREPKGALERRTGARSRLVDVSFLTTGVSCSRSVVRVNAFFEGESLTGTGFFIAPGRLLTNHHVLFNEGRKASGVTLWFDYEVRADGTLANPVTVEVAAPTIHGQADHDWATLEVPGDHARGVPSLPLGASRAVGIGDYVSIIQHPHGLPKKLGIFGSEVRHADQDVLQYLTDTEEGSSGAPVFNERWEVVALHHAWTEAAGAAGPEIRNEGIHIGRVVDALKQEALLS